MKRPMGLQVKNYGEDSSDWRRRICEGYYRYN